MRTPTQKALTVIDTPVRMPEPRDSWWTRPMSRATWVALAATEAARMERSPEGRRMPSRFWDDL